MLLGLLVLQLFAQKPDPDRIDRPTESGNIPNPYDNLPEAFVSADTNGVMMHEGYLKEQYNRLFIRPYEYEAIYNRLKSIKEKSMAGERVFKYGSEQDSLALVSLYHTTHGDYWKDNSNWLDSPLFPLFQPGEGDATSWYGIKVTHSGVREMDLRHNQLTGWMPPEIGDLSNLKGFDLYSNRLTGSIPEKIGNLNNLLWLNLSANRLTGSIPGKIGDLNDLQYLDLARNQFIGKLPAEIGNLGDVKYLYIAGNRLTGSIPAGLGNLNQLERLVLSNNQFSGSIPPEMGQLSKLQDLNLGRNQLTGNLPAEIGNLNSLQSLILADNRLTGSIPAEISNLSNLRWLHLSGNQLCGSIPSELTNLSNLSVLELDRNGLTGSVPSELSNLSQLRIFRVSDNRLSGLPDLSSLANLSLCDISNNNFDFDDLARSNISAEEFIYAPQACIAVERQEENEQLTLKYTGEGSNNTYQWYNGDTQLSGETDSILTISDTADGAYYCKASNENFPDLTLQTTPEEAGNSGTTKGIITAEYEALVDFYNATDGETWDESGLWLSDTLVALWPGIEVDGVHVKAMDVDALSGSINSVFESLRVLDRLISLSLFWQSSEGSLPAEMGDLENLETLTLEGDLHGHIPPEIGHLSRLKELKLFGRLSGNIPSSVGNLSHLKTLDLAGNQLTGSIPPEIGHLSNLEMLSLGGNQLSSIIPPDIGKLDNLNYLRLGRNLLSGSIPHEIGNLVNLVSLDLGYNQLSGSIPQEIGNLTHLEGLYLDNNRLCGCIPDEIGNLASLSWIELSNNRLDDSIPAELGNMDDLVYLRLRGNRLTGDIPSEMGNLEKMFLLDLAENQISGGIPPGFSQIHNLRLLLEHNNLSELPDLSQLTNINHLNVQNNQLTFEDLEPNAGAGIFWIYSPQGKVGRVQNDQVDQGASKTLSVDVGGAYNSYQWYQDETLINGASGDTLKIEHFSAEDEGMYVCEITNNLVSGLKLVSRPITLSSSPFHTAVFHIEDTANAVEGAKINIHKQTLITDTTGTDSLELPNGKYHYEIHAPGFKKITDTLTLEDGDVEKAFTLQPNEYPLTVYVYDGGSQPIPDATVVVREDTVITDQDGFAAFFLPNGKYSYDIRTDAYGSKTGETEISNEPNSMSITFERDYRVLFTVREDDEPIEGASIEINGQMLTTSADGEASVVLGNGQYTYEVTAPDYQSVKSSIVVAYSEMTEKVILSPVTYLVTFTVTDGTTPVEGAVITINDSELTTDAGGEDSIHLADGEYGYTVTAEGYEDYTNSLTVSGDGVEEEIALTATMIDPIESSAIKVYPNPACTILTIETNRAYRVEMVTIEGKVVMKKEINDAVTRLDIRHVHAGVYILRFYINKGKIHTEKLLIH